MATERITGEKNHVSGEEDAAQADAEAATEVESNEGVEPEKSDLDHGGVEGEAVEVVEHPWQGGLAAITPALWFCHRARPRMQEKGTEVRLAVVVAGEPERKRSPGDPDPRRDRSDFDQRRVEGAHVRSEIAVVLKEDDPDREQPKETQGGNHESRIGP